MPNVTEIRRSDARGIQIRKSHPGLYYSITILAFAQIALALNYFFATRPTFTPYGIPIPLIGWIFLILGISKLFFLNVVRNLKVVRSNMVIGVAFLLFWGISNTQQSFQGKASFAFPIGLITVALLQAVWVVEPSINPVSRRE